MRGRYPAGIEYVDHFDAAPAEKERLKAIVQTLCGVARFGEACERVGLRERRLRQLRDQAVQGALDAMRPRPAGRPSAAATAEGQRIGELEAELAAKELELQQALVRAEVALILPQRNEGEREKKGRRTPANRPRRRSRP
jgi:hypothetical protein